MRRKNPCGASQSYLPPPNVYPARIPGRKSHFTIALPMLSSNGRCLALRTSSAELTREYLPLRRNESRRVTGARDGAWEMVVYERGYWHVVWAKKNWWLALPDATAHASGSTLTESLTSSATCPLPSSSRFESCRSRRQSLQRRHTDSRGPGVV